MSHSQAEGASESPVHSPFSGSADGCPSPDSFECPHNAHNSMASSTSAPRPKPKIDPHTKKEICEIGQDGKYLYNSHARQFGKIVQQRCVDPQDFYVSWTKVPHTIKEEWFDEFLVKYSHLGYSREQAFDAFINYGMEAYKNVVGKMKTAWKKNGEKAGWMSEALWEKWLAYWRDPKVKARSDIASQNRRTGAGGVGSSTHAGGSVSFSQKIHILKSQNGGKDVNLLDAFVNYNAKKDENGKVRKNETGEIVFVHPRKKRVVNDYVAQFRPDPTSEGEAEQEGENRFDVTNIPFDPDKWIESTGGIRKGRILGFGSKMALFREASSGQSSQSTRTMLSQDSTSHQELQQLVEEARHREDEARHREDEARRREDDAVRREQEMRTRMEEMMETQRIMHQTQIDMQAQMARVLSQSNVNHSRPRRS